MLWSDKKMNELFQTNMIVPEYQRVYSWKEQHIDDFFSDLEKFIERKEDYYLFGQVIIHNDKGKRNIVDGQQRITTSTIFLCALRDIYCERDLDRPWLLNILNNAIGFEEVGFRLISNTDNKDFFFNYVQRGDKKWPIKHSSDASIKDAYIALKSKIDTYIDNFGAGASEGLKTLTEHFLGGFHLSYVETDIQSQAFIIFETLNSRGTPLNAPDLIKNHIFSRIDPSHDYIKDQWVQMARKISSSKHTTLTQYLRYFWNATRSFIREKDLFREVSVLEDKELFVLLSQLFSTVDTYILLTEPETIVNEFDSDCKNSLCNLNEFGASSYFPLIMSLKLINSEPKDIALVAKALECMIFRNQIIGKKVANSNEMAFSNWALSLYNGTPIKQIIYEIYEASDSDEKVSSGFAEFEPKKLGGMILRNIYNYEHPELHITKDKKKVHLEHILPRNPEKWNIPQEEADPYIWRFGNMTLLLGKWNEKASNSPFEVKKKFYAESEIHDTKALSYLDEWTFADIEKRQKNLCIRALQRWPKLIIPDPKANTLDDY